MHYMHFMKAEEVHQSMNSFSAQRKPFFFAIDYELHQGVFLPVEKGFSGDESFSINGGSGEGILFDIRGKRNFSKNGNTSGKTIDWNFVPESFQSYEEKFSRLQGAERAGRSWLANLTFRVPLHTSLSLEEIFFLSGSESKLHVPGSFSVFSPESFIRIENDEICTFPMKGTRDFHSAEDEKILLGDEKEKAEHATIVDLLRNDLSRVARRVRVERYRYIEKINTGKGHLLQTSSKICGELSKDWFSRVGDIVFTLLPAGSVTGAPKKETVELLGELEQIPRGFYSGIFGIFDGQTLDSAVAIRFVEQTGGQLYYRTGGGITIYSRLEDEYHEHKAKVYLPVARNN